jgi:hypothetical protein
VFYQLLEAATDQERDDYFLGDMKLEDFALVNQSGTYDRRDMVSDVDMHREMLDAMVRIVCVWLVCRILPTIFSYPFTSSSQQWALIQ